MLQQAVYGESHLTLNQLLDEVLATLGTEHRITPDLGSAVAWEYPMWLARNLTGQTLRPGCRVHATSSAPSCSAVKISRRRPSLVLVGRCISPVAIR